MFVNDKDFVNDDNPYGKFVYHLYTNMKDVNDTSKDVEDIGYYDYHVPLVDCSYDKEFSQWIKAGVVNYCPYFGENCNNSINYQEHYVEL